MTQDRINQYQNIPPNKINIPASDYERVIA